jgi:hypothetical protein
MDPFSGVHLFHFVVILLCNFDSILRVVLAPFSLFNSILILAIPPHVFLTSSNDQTTPQNNATVSNCTSTRQINSLGFSCSLYNSHPTDAFFFLSAPPIFCQIYFTPTFAENYSPRPSHVKSKFTLCIS